MVQYSIKIHLKADSKVLKDALETQEYPENMKGELLPFSTVLPYIKNDVVSVVVTDDKETVEKLTTAKPEYCYIVFCGSSTPPDAILTQLDDLWTVTEATSRSEIYFRCGLLLQRIKSRLDSEFYKKALETTIDTIPDMIWFTQLDGRYSLVNDAFLKLSGKPKNTVIGYDDTVVWNERRLKEDDDYITSADDESLHVGMAYIGSTADEAGDNVRRFMTYKRPVSDPFGSVVGTVGVCANMTSFENLCIKLSMIIENVPYPMTIFSRDWRVVRMNSSFKELLGDENLTDFDYRIWKQMHIVPSGERHEDKPHNAVSQEFEIEVNGEKGYYLITEFEVRDYFDNIAGYFCTVLDNSYRRSYEDSILAEANTDVLTGMHNRRFFFNYVRGSVKKPFYLLYLDLDHFKTVNDTFGHDAGDAVLVRLSQLINMYFPDAIAARLGGDEFALIDDINTREQLEESCRQLESTVRQEFRMYECDLGVSVGMVYSDGKSENIEALLHESDVRMYEVKKIHHQDQ